MAAEQELAQGGEDQEGMNGVEGEPTMNGDAEGHELDGQQAQPMTGIVGDRQPNKERITTPYLTKYERARVLGTRALQIRCVILALSLSVYVYEDSLRARPCSA